MTTFTGALYPFQVEGVAFLVGTRRAMLADDVGLGKTVQIAAAIAELWETEGSRRRGLAVLYVTAASLVAQTTNELGDRLLELSVEAAGSAGRRSGERPAMPNLLVVSHEFTHANAGLLIGHRPWLVVVDEASALKGGKAEFESVREMCDEAKRVIVATATPFENDPLELWTVMELVGSGRLGEQDDFLDRFCRVRYFDDGSIKVEGWKSDDRAREAMDRIAEVFLRRTAQDASIQLPEREETEVVLVPQNPAQRAALARTARIQHGLTRYRRQTDAVRAHGGVAALVEAAVRIVVRETREGRKVVLYTDRIQDLNDVCRALNAASVRYVSVQGDTPRAARADAVRAFRDDTDVHVLLGTKVLEYGLNLQFANTLISVGISYNPARERQREGRLRRIGSPTPATGPGSSYPSPTRHAPSWQPCRTRAPEPDMSLATDVPAEVRRSRGDPRAAAGVRFAVPIMGTARGPPRP